ncbi:MAG TPA: amidohydrolase [Steroidobacteraceae bacterium]|nr:amidohydrolase [Steroidobacteraceae bacterium]
MKLTYSVLARIGPALIIALFARPTFPAERADLVLYNAKVITVDKRFAVQSAVAIKGGKILAVGGPTLVKNYQSARTIDLHGQTLMPGFIDAHVHLFGLSDRQIEPEKAASIADLQAMLASKAKKLGPGEWITGYGWDEAHFAEKRVPSRADLDRAAPLNPVVLTRAGSHSVVGNSAAFKLAGINAATGEPTGGVIERAAGGEPSGIIRERNDLLTSLVPRAPFDEMKRSYLKSLRALLALGITSYMEARTNIDDEPVGKGGLAPGAAAAPSLVPPHSWKEMRSLYSTDGDRLPRATLYIDYPGAERLKAFPYHTGYGNDRVKLGPIGESPYDGGFTGPTALTKEDYKGQPGFRGRAFMTPDAASEMVATSASLGWQLGIHAIGDAAIETMSGIYHNVLISHPRKDHRWFLAHFTMLPSEATMDMLAHDGVWATAQPNFLYNLEGRYEALLDGKRLEHINPVATPLKHGIKLAFSSDNLPIGPMVGLYVAISRSGSDGRIFGLEEAVGREEAIRLYTIEAAKLAWDETKKGSIEPGKFADLIVLDHDLLTVPVRDILNTKIVLTMVGGKIVYEQQPSTD